jgi:hypothetical protein
LDFKDLKAAAVKGVEEDEMENGKYYCMTDARLVFMLTVHQFL